MEEVLWCGGLMGYIRMRILDNPIAVQLINGQQGTAGRTHMPACQVVIQGRFEFQLGMSAGRTAMFLPVLSQSCPCVFVHNRQPTGSVRSHELNRNFGKSHAMQVVCKSLQTQEGHSRVSVRRGAAGFALCGSLERDKRS